MNLTELEVVALICLWQSSDGNGHDFGYTNEIPALPKSSRGGVVASLANKGIIDIHHDPCIAAVQFTFTEKGQLLFKNFYDSPALIG